MITEWVSPLAASVAIPQLCFFSTQREDKQSQQSEIMAMDQKLVAGAGGAGIVFLAVVFLAIVSSRGGDQNLEEIQFLRR